MRLQSCEKAILLLSVLVLFFVMLFHATKVLLVIKTLKDDWYVVRKAYKFTVYEILRDFLHTACPRYPHI